ncbi:MAG: sugar transferase [Bacteroidales bacterium]|nr:sugar transferase [Bacteroidales bacterium]
MSCRKKISYPSVVKPVLDFIIAACLLLVTSPVLLTTIMLLAFANGRDGIFFLQSRPGKGGKIFRIIKFKTMNDRRGPDGELLPDAQRLTAAGRFIRSSSIDELPQLVNVLKGDMAIVGPRPLLVQYLPLYSPEQARRHEVKPGITGWAQVNGRNAISWGRRFELDVWYVDHVSFRTDFKIIWRTISAVFSRRDISQKGEATMKPFNGRN